MFYSGKQYTVYICREIIVSKGGVYSKERKRIESVTDNGDSLDVVGSGFVAGSFPLYLDAEMERKEEKDAVNYYLNKLTIVSTPSKSNQNTNAKPSLRSAH